MAQNKKSLLTKIGLGLSLGIPSAEALFYRNSIPTTTAQRCMGITHNEPLINSRYLTLYVGNLPEGFVLPAISGFIGDCIESQGQKRSNRLLQNIGKYFPEISTSLMISYITLGETVLPQIYPGTADIKDVPAVIISALAGYTLAKIGRSSGFNNKVYRFINKFNEIKEKQSEEDCN
jgi:hypothetical protein